MQFLVKQASVGALAVFLAGVVSAREAGANSATGPKVVPGGYVVELDSAANANAPAFFLNVSSNEINVTPRLTLTHSLFDGVSFIVAPEHDNETTFDTIQSFSSVKRIWPLRLYSRPATTITLSSALKEISSAPLKKRDSDVYAVHSMGGVDKLRAEGYDGEGMFVAIIDTGVDYNHPLLGGGFGPGFKIAYGYDLVGDGYDGTNTPVPDDDPMDCLGHGTHVAGIVGANPSIDLGFSGVVPNATLGMWKVFGCYDNVGDDVLIAAFNMAYEADFPYLSATAAGDFGTTNLPLYAITLDTKITNDACSALDPSTPDLSSYVVLVRRGSCTFSSKIANVAAFGAKAVLIYNNADGLTTPTTTSTTILAAMVLAAQGAKWISDLVSGLAVTIEFTALANSTTITAIGTNSLSGGTMSTFTSWGPTAEMFIKPEVSAPGGNILSTYLDGGYAVLSGTSMATPYIAGCVALIKQIKGKGISPVELNNLFSTTATLVKFNDGTGTQNFLTPVIQQGGGLFRQNDIPLNDTWNLVSSHSFTLTNADSKPVTYKLSNLAAGTIYTFDPDTVDVPIPAPFPTDYEFNLTTSATIRFEPSASITIPGKSSAVIEAHFTAPKGLDASEYRIPMYSGFISISSSVGETLSLPYAGAVGILKHLPLWSGAWGPTFVDQNYNPVLANTTFILPGPNSTYIPTEVPLMSTVLALACRIIRLDIVPLDTKGLPRVLGKQVLGAMPGYPYYYAVRQQLFESLWDGTLSTGEFVPKGTYKFLFRALSIFGDETYGPDWQSWESEYFNIEYA